MTGFRDCGRRLIGRLGGTFFLLAGQPLFQGQVRPPEGLQLLRRGAIPFMPRTAPILDQSGPSICPRLSQQAHNIAVVVAGIRDTHLEQPIAAGLADHQRALQHALA